MRRHVGQVDTCGQGPVNDGLWALERLERDRAIRLSNAAVGLEAFTLAPMLAAQQQQYVHGDINVDELLRMNGLEPEPGYPAA